MKSHKVNVMLTAIVGVIAVSGSAYAGGFSRGEANTDILFEDGAVNFDAGVVYVSPHRTYDTINGVASTDGRYSKDYYVPNLALKASVFENFACALTYTQPFGADSDYGPQANVAAGPTGKQSVSFSTNEFGGTCAVRFDAGPGRLHVIGGLFSQSFDYKDVRATGTLTLKDDHALGYRLGLGYDIPQYAMRASLMYRSQVEHGTSGTFLLGNGTPLPAISSGKLPQSVELNVQSGVAPGWLVYGSVKWTDWSVLQTLTTTITGVGTSSDNYFWRDGWTVQAGVGHQFNEDVAGTVNLTWDRGVGTGADIMTDTWTLGAGAEINAGPGKFRIGGGISYLTSGGQTAAKSGSYAATAGGDWAYALTASYKVKF